MSLRKQLIRDKFNAACLNRDGFACVFCKATGKLEVHHITNRKKMPNGGYVMANGITLCPDCHLSVERYNHPTPESLYNTIKSSYQEALDASTRLV